MASRYWVGGTGAWNSSSNAHWSDTSGGTNVSLCSYLDESNYANNGNFIYNGGNTAFFQTFIGNGESLNKARFYLFKQGSPTGYAYAKLYAMTGTYGTSGKPTGSVLATSAGVDVSTFGSNPAGISWKDFTFSNQTFKPTSGVNYCISIEYTGGNSSSNCIVVGTNRTNAHSGNYGYYDTAWYANSNADLIFYLYTNVGAPTQYDDVIFDLHSNESGDTAYSVTTYSGSVCCNWDASFTGTTKVTFTGTSYAPSVYGSLNLSGGSAQVAMSYSNAYISFNATSGTNTIATNGVALPGIQFYGTGGTFQLQDDLSVYGIFYLVNGTFLHNNKTVTLDGLGISHAIYGSPTFYNLTIGGTNGSMVSLTNNITISNTFSITNTGPVQIYTEDSFLFPQITITSASNSLRNVSFLGIIGAGTANWDLSAITGGSGNAGYNSGITFTTPTTQHWTNVNGGAWGTASNWTSRVPLPQDTILMDCAFGTSKTVTGSPWYYVGDIDWSGATFTTALTWETLQVKFTDSIKLKVGMTLTQWLEVIGDRLCLLTTAGVILPRLIDCRKPGGILKLGDNLTMAGANEEGLHINSGTFDTNSYNVTVPQILSSCGSETDASTFYFRNSTITVTGSGYGNSVYWVNPGDTIEAGASTLKFTGVAGNSQLILGGHHYNTVWLDHGSTWCLTIISHSNYFNEFKDTSTNAGAILFVDDYTNHFNKFTVSGSAGNLKTISNTTSNGEGVHTHFVFDGVGTVQCNYLNVIGIDAQPSNTWYVGGQSTDGGNNTGLLFASRLGQDNTDVITISDSITKEVVYYRTIADTVSIIDSDIRSMGFNITADDTVSLSESSDVIKLIPVNNDETVSLSDTIERIVTYERTVDDTMSIIDSVVTVKASTSDLEESVSLSDAIVISVGHIRTIADTMSMAESIAARKQTADVWKSIVAMKINIGGQWTDLF